MSDGVPPPLPWKVRTGPERLVLVFAAACAFVAAFLCLAHISGYAVSLCAWKCVTGLPCAGCGGTRALFLLMQGQPAVAIGMNPAVVLASLLLFLALLYAVSILVFRLEPWRPSMLRGKSWRFVVAAGLLLNWVYLLLAGRA